jgi:hypothetical protein
MNENELLKINIAYLARYYTHCIQDTVGRCDSFYAGQLRVYTQHLEVNCIQVQSYYYLLSYSEYQYRRTSIIAIIVS